MKNEDLSRSWRLALAAVALLPRLANLGSFSMWLDEVLQTLHAGGSLVAAWEADANYPPLDRLLTWTLLRWGAGETARRLLPIALGVATVLLLARWAARRFGPRCGLAAGLLAALSPLHVHYSQELRPYALGLFFVALTLEALDRLLLDGWTARRAVLLGAALAGCFYSLYFAVLVLVPAAWLVAEAALGGDGRDDVADEGSIAFRARRLAALSPALLAAVVVAYLPWVATVFSLPHGLDRGATHWSPALLADRARLLTAGGPGPGLGWGAVLALALIGLGAARAWREPPGRAVLAGALAGTAGVELLAHAVRHWSHERYDLMGWLFLVVLATLGIDSLLALPRGRPIRALGALALAALLAAQILGVAHDYRHGRADWLRVAQAVGALHRPGERVLAINEPTRTTLGYYLRREDPAAAAVLLSLDGSSRQFARLRRPRQCALLVTRVHGRQGGVPKLVRGFPVLATYPETEARIHLLTPGGDPGRCARTLPEALRHPRTERPCSGLGE